MWAACPSSRQPLHLRLKTLRSLHWLPLMLPILMLTGICFWSMNTKTNNNHHRKTTDPPLDGLPARDPQVVSTLRTSYLLPPSPLPYNLSRDPQYLVASRMGSWRFINHYMTRLFEGEREGFFVEAGALDGQQLSNTLWLEQEQGWTGLLIEPNPYSYQDLLHKHRKAWTANSCVSSQSSTKQSVHVSLTLRSGLGNPKWHVRGSSFEFGVTLKQEDSALDFSNISDKTYLMAYCFPLLSYLLALNVTKIDMLSLDTQGSEIDIIKTIPWQDVTIRVIVVEIIDRGDFQTDFVDYLRQKGYALVGNSVDYIFVLENDFAYKRLISHNDWYLKIVDDKNGNVLLTSMNKKVR